MLPGMARFEQLEQFEHALNPRIGFTTWVTPDTTLDELARYDDHRHDSPPRVAFSSLTFSFSNSHVPNL